MQPDVQKLSHVLAPRARLNSCHKSCDVDTCTSRHASKIASFRVKLATHRDHNSVSNALEINGSATVSFSFAQISPFLPSPACIWCQWTFQLNRYESGDTGQTIRWYTVHKFSNRLQICEHTWSWRWTSSCSSSSELSFIVWLREPTDTTTVYL